ncbi:MAG: hypothetical protein IJQ99_03870 [Synergistaceae bacterium]|nr:hypothetical protein [Synergistaceae bacterium]MBR0315981.1 hypothetical protein [Synergistaceae bacterium]
MKLLITEEFDGVTLDCYKAENEDDGFWATREQIGQLLEYSNPDTAIKNIHLRNAERLSKFSTQLILSQVEGNRTVTRDVIVYNFKGFLEICRFSNQPKADAVIDFAWSVMDEIRRNGHYEATELDALHIRAAELLKDIAQYASPDEKKIIIHKAFQFVTGCEMPEKPQKTHPPIKFWTAEQIAKTLKWSANAVMLRAENLGLTEKAQNGYWDGKTWYFSKEGRKKFFELVRDGVVKIKDGYAYYEEGYKRIYWSFEV